VKKRDFILYLAIALSVTSITSSVKANPPSQAIADSKQEIEKEIRRLEEAGRQKILRADNNWDDLIAEGAYMIGFDGSVVVYQKGTLFPALTVTSFNLSEMIARVYEDVVVVTGLAEVVAESPDKKPFSFQMRFINVWKKSGGSWKIVVSERTGVRPVAKQ
jgi:ketosteroid isomerase-like protein